MIRPLLAALFLLLLPAVAHAQCNPVNSPTQSPGCWPQASSISGSTDYLLGWQPGQFPASAVRIPANLIPGIGILPLANGGTGQSQPFGRTATTFARGDYVWVGGRAVGMQCDGSTNDSTALQTALLEGFSIILPGGSTCVLNGTVNATSLAGVTTWMGIKGDGTSTLKFTGGSGIIVTGPSTTDSAFLFLDVDGVNFLPASAGAVSNALMVENTAPDGGKIKITNNVFGDTTETNYFTNGPLLLHNAGNSRVELNHFYSGPANISTIAALHIEAVNAPGCNACGNWIQDNVIRGGYYGIWITGNGNGSTTFNPEGEHINRNGIAASGYQILVDQSSATYQGSGYFLEQNEVQASSGNAAIWLKNAAQINVTDNFVGGSSSGNGIELDNSSKFTITGNNTDTGGTSTGIKLVSDTEGAVTGNTMSDASIGIDLNGTSTDVVLANNNAYANVTTPVAGALVSDCVISSTSSGTNPIAVSCGGVQIGGDANGEIRLVPTSGTASPYLDWWNNGAEDVRVQDEGGHLLTITNGSAGWRGLRSFPLAFGSIPACSSSLEGATATIMDSATATWGATITGSGANHVLGYCDGTNWTVAGR